MARVKIQMGWSGLGLSNTVVKVGGQEQGAREGGGRRGEQEVYGTEKGVGGRRN
jgi:hypothetical protein